MSRIGPVGTESWKREKARRWLRSCVRKGRIKRPNRCSSCGTPCHPDGHHPDYDKPLEVVWLCKPCHRELHGSRTLKEFHAILH